MQLILKPSSLRQSVVLAGAGGEAGGDWGQQWSVSVGPEARRGIGCPAARQRHGMLVLVQMICEHSRYSALVQ